MVTDATMQLTIPRASKSDGSLAPSTAHWSLTRERHILAGAHTMGQAQCQNYRARIYNDTDIDAAFAASLRAGCPAAARGGASAPLDAPTPKAFDNAYYGNLVAQRGLLHSDQELFNGGSTDGLVRSYAASPARFSSDFAAAMVRMGGIGVLTGSSGQIRRNCRRVN